MPAHDCTRCAKLGLVTLCLSACATPTEPTEPDPEEPPTCLDYEEIVSPVPDLPVTYQTEHLDIHVDGERFLCAGSAVDYERFAQYVAAELDIEIQRRVPVYAMRSVSGYCSASGGCATKDGVVFAKELSAYHELAHGVACEVRTGAPALLAEGLARSLEPFANDQKGDPTQLSETRSKDFGPYYYHAGHFVRWLLEQLGPDAFKSIYRSATYEDGVWSAIETVYGAALAPDYAAEAPLMWIPHRQCADMPLLEPGAEGWTFAARLDCDDEATLGPYEKTTRNLSNSNTEMYQSFLIDVPEPGKYRMERSDSLVHVRYERCLDEHPASEAAIDAEWVKKSPFFTFIDDYSIVEFEHAGLWRIDVLHEYGTPVDIWLTIVPEPG
ncbi:MAG: hypothetical protein HC927_11670 [Deltaproteobacteria bacterium]|nr:hypothetical protein [Deltaproteobacteria bacterium]